MGKNSDRNLEYDLELSIYTVLAILINYTHHYNPCKYILIKETTIRIQPKFYRNKHEKRNCGLVNLAQDSYL